MIICRLGIDKPSMHFKYTLGSCGCKILETPVGTFTWYAANCKCEDCEEHVCECYCDNCGHYIYESERE